MQQNAIEVRGFYASARILRGKSIPLHILPTGSDTLQNPRNFNLKNKKPGTQAGVNDATNGNCNF